MKKAFTFLELLTVISIMAILLLIARFIPSPMEASIDRVERNRLIQEIRNLQTEAMISGHTTEFAWERPRQTYVLFNGVDKEEVVLKKLKLAMDFRNSVRKFCFYASGRPSYGGTLKLEGEDFITIITIEPTTGRIRVYEEK